MRWASKIIVIIILLWVCINDGFAQKSLNLDFELESFQKYWGVTGEGIQVCTDSLECYSGKFSLKIQKSDSSTKTLCAFYNELPISLFAGKNVQLRGWMKTENLTNGSAGLFFNIYGAKSVPLGINTLFTDGVKGDSDWKQVILTSDISADVRSIIFGGLITGEGRAWYDHFELYINGEKYIDFIESEPKSILSQKEIAALRKYIYPLRTYEPDGRDMRDLKVLDKLIGRSAVVALGEVSHGSEEIFKMKHRIIQYLAENKGFNVFALEGFMAESYKMNDYVISGQGNPGKILADNIWCWNTEEILKMSEWMYQFNKGKERIWFTGFDMQSYEGSVWVLHEAFAGNRGVLDKLDDLKKRLDEMAVQRSKAGLLSLVETEIGVQSEVDSILLLLQRNIEQLSISAHQKKWLQQNALILRQYTSQRGSFDINWRDRCMADNVKWIQTRNPGSKLVVWGHNSHIMKQVWQNMTEPVYHVMGSLLARELGDDYVSVGFTFYEGSFTAQGKQGRVSYPAEPAIFGTLEYLLNQLNEPVFLLDLKKIRSNPDRDIQWLLEPLDYRGVGMIKGQSFQDEFHRQRTITNDFDYLIFIKKSSASALLPSNRTDSPQIKMNWIEMPTSSGFNLDFELVENGIPIGWQQNGTEHARFSVDSLQVKSGKYSVMMEIQEGTSQFGVLGYIIRENYEGNEVTLSGYVKTENVSSGYASLLVRIEPQVGLDHVKITGTTDWMRYEVTVKMDSRKEQSFAFGVTLVGTGKVWIDDLRISIDGKDIHDLKPIGKALIPSVILMK